MVAVDGDIVSLPQQVVTMLDDAPVREGQTLQFDVDAPIGAVSFLLVTADPAWVLDAGLGGVLALGGPPALLDVLPAQVSGGAQHAFPIPELGPGVESVALYAQALALGSSELGLSTPARALVLDGAF